MTNKVDLVFELNNVDELEAKKFEEISRNENMEPDEKVLKFIKETVNPVHSSPEKTKWKLLDFYDTIMYNENHKILIKDKATDTVIRLAESYKDIVKYENKEILGFASDCESKIYICWI